MSDLGWNCWSWFDFLFTILQKFYFSCQNLLNIILNINPNPVANWKQKLET